MLICNPCSYRGGTELLIMLDDTEINQVEYFKYLGVYVDDCLNFEKHTEKLIDKISQRTGLLWGTRRCINKELAKYLYQSLIEPHYIYCQFIYDACSINMKRKLQVSQNKALRAVLNVPNDYPSEALHTETNIEWLGVMRAKASCLETFKLLHNIGTDRSTSMVNQYRPNRPLRSSNKVTIEKLKTHTSLQKVTFCIQKPILNG